MRRDRSLESSANGSASVRSYTRRRAWAFVGPVACAALVVVTASAVSNAGNAIAARPAISEASCDMIAIAPYVRLKGGYPVVFWGRGRYVCTAGGYLTVRLQRSRSGQPGTWVNTLYSAQTHTVPARSTWSGIYYSRAVNCSAYTGAYHRTKITFSRVKFARYSIGRRSCG